MQASLCIALMSVLVGLGVATPTSKPCTGTHKNINFEDLEAGLVGGVSNTTTGGLFFQGYGVSSNRLQVSGLVAHSPLNLATTGSIQQMLNGNAMITTNFPNSPTKSFDMNNAYLGCYVSADASKANAPQACTISMAGYKGSDNSVANAKQVCAYAVSYNPSTNVGNQQMTYSGPFPSTCKGLNFLTFSFTIMPQTVNALQPRLAMGMDNVDVNTYTC